MTRKLIGLLALAGALCLFGCAKEEGPAEQAGQKVDEAAGQAGDAAKDAGDQLKDLSNN
ncbi:MAG: hypothetical protein ACYTGG_03125 [Planctomycetota bacterium]|jgi:hypothetical protein